MEVIQQQSNNIPCRQWSGHRNQVGADRTGAAERPELIMQSLWVITPRTLYPHANLEARIIQPGLSLYLQSYLRDCNQVPGFSCVIQVNELTGFHRVIEQAYQNAKILG